MKTPRILIPLLLVGLVPPPLLASDPPEFYRLDALVDPVGDGHLGFYVWAGRDVDGDVLSDFLVQKWNWVPDGPSALWALSGVDRHVLAQWVSIGEAWSFGKPSLLADIDGDGVDDTIIGDKDSDAVPEGSVRVYAGLSQRLIVWLRGNNAVDLFGDTVAVLDDLDGDGWRELLVGAPASDTGNFNAGSVYLISARTGDVIWEQDGETRAESMPFGLENLGDIDADGVSDFIVSSRDATVSGMRRAGRVWVYSGRTLNLIYELAGDQAGIEFGSRVAVLGDTDRDGISDFSVGDNELVYIYSGLTGTRRFTLNKREGDVGYNITRGADYDADGVNDFLALYPKKWNHVAVYSGVDGSVLGIVGDEGVSPFGERLASVPDLTGDGLPDLVAAAGGVYPHPGMVFVYGLKSLKRVETEGAGGGAGKAVLRVRAPALANQTVMLLLSASADHGTTLLGRSVPLDPDALFQWSLSHPILIPLDANGCGRFQRRRPDLGQLERLSLYAVYVAIDPARPGCLSAVSNAERLSP
ncbi:MAG: integrin alpha [Planctomycetota bacterium]